MFNYVWPIALAVFSNVLYHICAKSMPAGLNPLASLSVTYVISTVASLVLYFALNSDASLIREYRQLNWAPVVLGIVIVGLESGFIYAYQAGWPVSTAAIVQSCFLALALIFAGYLLYQEPLTWNKLSGVAVCLVGLILINLK